MWDFLKNLKEFLSLNYRSLFIVSGLCWVIAFLPTSFLDSIGLLGFWSQYRPWAIALGILFTTWLVFGGFYDIVNHNKDKLTTWIKSRETKKTHEKLLLTTSRVEKEVLSRYLAEDTTTISFDYRDGIVNGLIAKEFLYRASQASNPMSLKFDVNIQGWVWDYLKQHPEILEGIESRSTGRHQKRF